MRASRRTRRLVYKFSAVRADATARRAPEIARLAVRLADYILLNVLLARF